MLASESVRAGRTWMRRTGFVSWDREAREDGRGKGTCGPTTPPVKPATLLQKMMRPHGGEESGGDWMAGRKSWVRRMFAPGCCALVSQVGDENADRGWRCEVRYRN